MPWFIKPPVRNFTSLPPQANPKNIFQIWKEAPSHLLSSSPIIFSPFKSIFSFFLSFFLLLLLFSFGVSAMVIDIETAVKDGILGAISGGAVNGAEKLDLKKMIEDLDPIEEIPWGGRIPS